MFEQLQSSAQAVWHSGFVLTTDDPEDRARFLYADQVRRVGEQMGLDRDEARDAWLAMIAEEPMALTDPREIDSAVCITAGLPDRLMKSMPDRACAFVACFTKIRSNRPWRCEWVVALGSGGPIGVLCCDMELSVSEFSEVQ